jgi:hypothetical protein
LAGLAYAGNVSGRFVNLGYQHPGIEQTDAAVIGAVDGGTVVVAIKPPESQQ